MKPSLLLVWHEAGNPIYRDRFYALAKHFELTVVGFKSFQGVDFPEYASDKFEFKLYNGCLNKHWLTVFSFRMFTDSLRHKFDYIYLHEEPHSILSLVFTLISRKANIIIDAAVINKKLNFFGLNIFENYVYSKASHIFYRNNQVRKTLIERGAQLSTLKAEIGNGVSRRVFKRNTSPKDNAQFTIGFAGRIWKWKGLEVLIDIAHSHPGIVIKVCGPVVDHWLEEKLRAAGVMVLPKLDGESLCKFYQSLDLFILPSLDAPGWSEQFGRVIVESVFSGTPAIGSTTGFIPFLVGNKSSFKAGDKESLEKLLTRYESTSAREKLYNEQYNRFQNEYSWDGVARKVIDSIRQST